MEFNDPVVRCVDCQRLIFRQEIRKFSMCPYCGTRRMKNVLVLNDKEMEELKTRGIDPEFIALFEPVTV